MKRCTLCNADRPLEAFNRKRRSRDGLQNVCRDCNRARSARYYRDNREAHRATVLENSARYKTRMRSRLIPYLISHPCVDCGETDIRLLEFDHRPESGKTRDVSYLLRGGASWTRVEAELQKCDVRCRHCHALITYARSGGNWRTRARDLINASVNAFLLECERVWDEEASSVGAAATIPPLASGKPNGTPPPSE